MVRIGTSRTAAKGKAPAAPDRQPIASKIKRVLRSASKPSSEPPTTSDEDDMQEERRVSTLSNHILHFSNA
jgi:hypothetical protein